MRSHKMLKFDFRRKLTRSIWLFSLVSCFAGALNARAATSSYSVTIAPGYDLVDYCFQTNTVANALPNAVDGTQVAVLNPATKVYTTSLLYSGTWSPNVTLTPGEGFFIWNPGPRNFTYTVQGTPLTSSTFIMNFVSTNVYLVGSAFYTNVADGADFLSCQLQCDGGSRYVTQSYNYVPSVGDHVQFYCPDTQNWSTNNTFRTIANQCDLGNGKLGPLNMWDNSGPFYSPMLIWEANSDCSGSAQPAFSPFRAIALYPSGGTTSWVQKAGGETCPRN